MKITMDEFVEQDQALALMNRIESMMAHWQKATKAQVPLAEKGVKTRFEYLFDMVGERHGSNGHLGWNLLMLSIAINQYFEGQVPEQEFQFIRERFNIAFEAFMAITKPCQGNG